MIKLGLVGSDSSHADAFSRLCNLPEGFEGCRIRGARVVAIYGQDPKRTEEVARNGRIPTIVARSEHMIGIVDAVLVVFRHGDWHAPYALPFLRAGIPAFVDKPFAIQPADARRMLAEARRRKVLLTSFSTLRYTPSTRAFLHGLPAAGQIISGSLKGPATLDNEYGGLPFYGSHLTELLTEIFGYGVSAVQAVEHGGNVHATVAYRDGKLVNLQFLAQATHQFHVTAHGTSGSFQAVLDTRGCYRCGLDVFLRMLRSGRRPLTDEQLLQTVRVTAAVVDSYRGGGQRVRL